MSRRLLHCTNLNHEKLIKKIFPILVCVILFLININAFASDIHRNHIRIFLKDLAHSQFSKVVTTGTTLAERYHVENVAIVQYDNIDPVSQHGMHGVVVFINNRYHHDYDLGGCDDFVIKRGYFTCKIWGIPGEFSLVSLRDIIAGRKVLIGGDLQRPWRNGKKMVR